jgi:hypothetical protein
LIYSIELRDKATVLARLKRDAHVLPSPDTGYRFVAGGEQLQGHDANKAPGVIGAGAKSQAAVAKLNCSHHQRRPGQEVGYVTAKWGKRSAPI